jgi:hypothetical protein
VSKTKVKSYVKKDGTKVRAHSKKNGWAVYSSNRRTPILVDGRLSKNQAIKKALSIKKRGSNQVNLVRRLTESEQRLADRKVWVRGHNIDKDRKKLRGVGPKPIGFNHNLNLILFAKPFRGLKKEQLEKLVKAGKNWAKRNRLGQTRYPELAVHDTLHSIGEKLNTKYTFAPLTPRLIKSRLKGTQEIINPYGVNQELTLLRDLSSRLTRKRNMKAESYVAGLEGSKAIDKNLDFDLTVSRPPNRKELEAYWLGRRARKKQLPKEYKILQRQQKEYDTTLSQVVKVTKPDLEVKPLGSLNQVKSHPRKTSNGRVVRVRAFKKRNRDKTKTDLDFDFDLNDFL